MRNVLTTPWRGVALTLCLLLGAGGIPLPAGATVLHGQVEKSPLPAAPLREAPEDPTPGAIGVEFRIPDTRTGYPRVLRVFPGLPASRTGLQAGDLLLAVDGASVAGISRPALDALISDVPGTRIHFTLQRGGKVFPVSVTVQALDVLSAPAQRRYRDDDP